MRLKKLELTKLFGMFNHSITLYDRERITIMRGPNGFGKTAILYLLRAVLSNQFAVLRRIQFDTLRMFFDNDGVLTVTKTGNVSKLEGREGKRIVLQYEWFVPNFPRQEFSYHFSAPNDLHFPLAVIDENLPSLCRVGPETWIQSSTGRLLEVDDVLEEYADFLPMRRRMPRSIPTWLTGITREFDVRLIEAQRLLAIRDIPRTSPVSSGPSFEPAVLRYSKELAAAIQEIQARYGTYSQQLDSTFPSRVIQTRAAAPIEAEELKARLRVLDENRHRIISAGLLTAEAHHSPIFDPRQPIDDTTKSILTLYLEDVEKKLSVFADITEKIELLKELINKRFLYKTLEIEGQNGFRIQTYNGNALLPNDLSSGEQHELVLLYELLFKTRQETLVLIDEPELSLQGAWQVEFLNDLKRVIKLSPFDVMLATHSSQIINDRWDLTVELKGPPL